jgi:hypothetical protein
LLLVAVDYFWLLFIHNDEQTDWFIQGPTHSFTHSHSRSLNDRGMQTFSPASANTAYSALSFAYLCLYQFSCLSIHRPFSSEGDNCHGTWLSITTFRLPTGSDPRELNPVNILTIHICRRFISVRSTSTL